MKLSSLFSGSLVAGVTRAGKALVVDANKLLDVLNVTLFTGTTVNATALQINSVAVAATALELNRAAQLSARLVAAGAALTATLALHDGRTILLDTAAGSVVTLPAALGTGARFRFQVKTTATSNSHKIQVANGTDIMQGIIFAMSDNAAAALGWQAGAADDTITLNRGTQGTAKVGDFIEIEDIAAGVFAVRGMIGQSGTEATPFSSAV